eukprot:g35799.t1
MPRRPGAWGVTAHAQSPQQLGSLTRKALLDGPGSARHVLGRKRKCRPHGQPDPERPAMAPLLVTTLLLVSVSFLPRAHSISFHLPANSRKCLREEIHKDVLVTGEYELSEQPGGRTDLK